jgi:hypothetical protein
VSDDWVPISCEDSDRFDRQALLVGATLTDMVGRFGEPRILTEWLPSGSEEPVLRDIRWPRRGGGEPDVRPCEHYVPAVSMAEVQP